MDNPTPGKCEKPHAKRPRDRSFGGETVRHRITDPRASLVLRWMSGDLTAFEWSQRLDEHPDAIVSLCKRLGVKLKPEVNQ